MSIPGKIATLCMLTLLQRMYNLSRGLRVRRRPSSIYQLTSPIHLGCSRLDGKGFDELKFAPLIGTGDAFWCLLDLKGELLVWTNLISRNLVVCGHLSVTEEHSVRTPFSLLIGSHCYQSHPKSVLCPHPAQQLPALHIFSDTWNGRSSSLSITQWMSSNLSL